MSFVNPLSGALLQSTQIQLQQAGEKAQQAKLAQERQKNVAAKNDEQEENQVENSDQITAIHDQDNTAEKRRKQQQHKQEEDEQEEEETSGLDLTA
jgi:hypothetical protein